MRAIIVFMLLLYCQLLRAQEDSGGVNSPDTIKAQNLKQVVITAYGQQRKLNETPASVNVINESDLNRYSNSNIAAAVNATPGIRMEERSPESYRINIRGSSLRSPFGVRNIKVYYNDIPITDASGFTYLNQLSFYNVKGVRIIKGPGSSLYGAGNGGVMLINSFPDSFYNSVRAAYTGGSYGLNNAMGEIKYGDPNFNNIVRYQHLNTDSYRENSAMRKDVFSWDATTKRDASNELSVHFLFNDLYYQTPGGLTLKEYNADPRSARPAVGKTPGALDNKAAIYERNLFGGFSYKHRFNSQFENTTTLYALYAQLNNPNIRNYSRTSEPGIGGRTTLKYKANIGQSIIRLQVGIEAQQGFAMIKTYGNIKGAPDTLQTDDETNNRNIFGFLQGTWSLKKWVLEAGLSLNYSDITITRLSNRPYTELSRNFGTEVSPRFALLYNAGKLIAPYINISRGFSPPTAAELSPSGSAINLALKPEQGWNYEIGARGLIARRLSYDMSVFYVSLENAIVQRRDSAGGDNYINAGGTRQPGLEAHLDYAIIEHPMWLLNSCNVWLSYAVYDFTYADFVQVSADFSGNKLPGVASNTLTAGFDISVRYGIGFNLTYSYTGKMALDDANLNYMPESHIVNLKLSYKHRLGKLIAEVYAGTNNLSGQKYSLGNDINAAGGRFYNAAPGINYYAGLSLTRSLK